jgi:hypothetical protein
MRPHRLHIIATYGRLGAGLLALVLVAAPAAAQSLGDVARREQSRRETAPKGKIYTNESLPVVPPPMATPPRSTPAASGSAEAAAPGDQAGDAKTGAADQTAKPGDAKKEEDKKDEAYWRDRIAKATQALQRDESFALALQSRINALSNEFVNRDDPAQRNQIAADRDKALAELDGVKKDIQNHRKALTEIREEGRKEGVPAGWLR